MFLQISYSVPQCKYMCHSLALSTWCDTQRSQILAELNGLLLIYVLLFYMVMDNNGMCYNWVSVFSEENPEPDKYPQDGFYRINFCHSVGFNFDLYIHLWSVWMAYKLLLEDSAFFPSICPPNHGFQPIIKPTQIARL